MTPKYTKGEKVEGNYSPNTEEHEVNEIVFITLPL